MVRYRNSNRAFRVIDASWGWWGFWIRRVRSPPAKTGWGIITSRFVLSNALKHKRILTVNRGGQPFNGHFGSTSRRTFIGENAFSETGGTGPAAGVFRVAAVLLEAMGAVGAAEQIDAARAVAVFQGRENQGPGGSGRGHGLIMRDCPFFAKGYSDKV